MKFAKSLQALLFCLFLLFFATGVNAQSGRFTLGLYQGVRLTDNKIVESKDPSADLTVSPRYKGYVVYAALEAKRLQEFATKPTLGGLTAADVAKYTQLAFAPTPSNYYLIQSNDNRYYLCQLERFENQGKAASYWKLTFSYEEIFLSNQGPVSTNPRTTHGKKVYADGSSYEGDFLDGKFHGKGVLQSPEGAYEGEFVAGQFQGRGYLRLTNGTVYEGEFADGSFQGIGKIRMPDGSSYEGQFVKGAMQGKGIIRLPGKGYYEGEFAEGKCNGQGTMYDTNGKVLKSGLWVNNEFVGAPVDTSQPPMPSIPQNPNPETSSPPPTPVVGISGTNGSSSDTADFGDLYYLGNDHLYFDINNLQYSSSGSREADIRLGDTSSAPYFQPVNGASITDLGLVNYEAATPPDSGYTSERVPVQPDHVFAIRCGGGFGILMVTGIDNRGSVVQFRTRLAAPRNQLNLYYLNRDGYHFDFETMKNAISSHDSDIYYKSSRAVLWAENGAAVADLGSVHFEGAQVLSSGYSTGEIKVVKDHVYAVRTGSKGYYLMKAIQVVTDGDLEFIALTAEPTQRLDLYYLSSENLRFSFDTMKNVPNSSASDLSFKYLRSAIVGDNGVTIQDLGVTDYDSATAPHFGYSTAEFKVEKNHVYAIRSVAKGLYVMKVTNVVQEIDLEFMARRAEIDPANPNPPAQTTQSGQYSNRENNLLAPDNGIAPKEPVPAPKENNPAPTPKPTNPPVLSVDTAPAIKGEVHGGKYFYNGKLILEIKSSFDWACISPNEKYVAYKDGQDINYYDIQTKKHLTLYHLTTDEYMGKYVYNYGFTAPINYDFFKWTDDSKAIIVRQWTTDIFKGGSGNYQITLADKKMTFIGK